MIRTIIEKEIRGVLSSPKFATVFALSGVLILLSIGLGIHEHRAFKQQQEAAANLHRQELAEAESWSEVRPYAFRRPDPLQIFVSGVHNDVGRLSSVSSNADVRLRHSVYSDDPILAIFRAVDVGFIVTVVLSLLAILFAHDAISGERELGTLRLIFANPVPRANFIAGKMLGIWIGLAFPLLLLTLIGLLLVVLSGVQLGSDAWARIVLLLLASALYCTCFVALGLAVSVLGRRSSSAFLVLLAAWVVLVLIVPRASLTAATHLVPAPAVSQVESQKAAFENAEWARETAQTMQLWSERSDKMGGMPEEERIAYEDENLWQWMEQDDQRRQETEQRIAENGRRLDEEMRNRQAAQARLALALGCLSPSATYGQIAMGLTGTDHTLKDRSEEAMRAYQADLNRFISAKGGNQGSRRIVTRRSGQRHDLGFGDDNNEPPVDLTEMPQLPQQHRPLAAVVAPLIPDFGILALIALLGFTVAFVGFLRSDVHR